MLTEKLYYVDAYISEFDATVTSVESIADKYHVVLDRTVFFPEEGGQESDKGKINGARVIDVREIDGKIIHVIDAPLDFGTTVHGQIDFEERYEKMKCHTAEHILCGVMHRLFGAENIGFRLGADCVTLDVDVVLNREQLDSVEDIANDIVSKNVAVTTSFPSSQELSSLRFRSKLDLTDGVRIVDIGEYDSCACCAPHVARTGEIGLIKMLDFEKHRGGTRIYMVAGKRALTDYRARYSVSRRISELTSTPQEDIADAVVQLLAERDSLAAQLKARGIREAIREAERVSTEEGNAVFFFDGFTIDELREFVNHAVEKINGLLVALSGSEGDYKYVIGSRTVDLKSVTKDINAALCGRGGGRSEMIQGTFSTTLDIIRAYFEK